MACILMKNRDELVSRAPNISALVKVVMILKHTRKKKQSARKETEESTGSLK
jgi:hypothetical protein